MNDIFDKKSNAIDINTTYYLINWVKQFNNTQEKINLLIAWDHWEEEIRTMFNKHLKIIIFWLTKYSNSVNTFWSTYIKFTFDEKVFTCVFETLTIPQVFEYVYTKIWIEIDYINKIESPYEDDKVATIIKWLQDKYSAIANETKAKEDKAKIKAANKKDDLKLAELKKIINETIAEADEMEQKLMWMVSSSEMKKFKDTVNELKKLRMGRNSENLVEILEKVIWMIEDFELEYIDNLKKLEIWEIKNSIINELDVVTEYEKFKKSQKVTQISKLWNVTKTFDDIYYQNMWKSWIYYRLLGKEIKARVFNKESFINWLYKYSELIILFIIFDLTIYFLYPLIMAPGSWTEPKTAIFFYIWNFWLAGIIVYFWKHFMNKNQTITISVYVISILVFILLNRVIIRNFAFN